MYTCSSVGGSRSQSDAEVESSLDDSFEFVADSAAAEVETTKMECEVDKFFFKHFFSHSRIHLRI